MKCLYTLACCLLLSVHAHADTPAVLLGADLEPTTIRLQSLSPKSITVTDRRGEMQTMRADDVLRLTLTGRSIVPPDGDRAILTLRDGQVLVGMPVQSNDDEAIRLKLDSDRAVQVPLDEVLSLRLSASAPLPAIDEDDALVLATGEVLLGFVETFTAEAIGFVIGDADDPVNIPIARIEAMAIANQPRPAELKPGTVRVGTTDGAVLYVQDATLTPSDDPEIGDELVGVSTLPILASRRADAGVSTDASTRLTLPIDRVAVIEPVSSRYALESLADLAWDVVSGGEVFGVAMPPKVSSEAIRLHAPTTLRYELPDRASRLALTVAMDLDRRIPETRRQMAGCELVIYLGDREVARRTLTPDGPPHRLNVALADASELRLALEPGVNGPVLDRVVIADAELLVSE
jgi:hypothetical protein